MMRLNGVRVALAALVAGVGALALVPSSAAGAFRRLYFESSAKIADYPLGQGQSFSDTLGYTTSYKVEASLAGREPLCHAYAQGRFSTNNGRPAALVPPTPGFGVDFKGPDGNTHTFEAFGFTAWPGLGRTGPGRYGWHTSEPFAIDHGMQPTADFVVTIKKDGSGSIVESSPHSYVDKWKCSALPPLSLEALGPGATTEGFVKLGDRVRVVGTGFEDGQVKLSLGGRPIGTAVSSGGHFSHSFELKALGNECNAVLTASQPKHHVKAETTVRAEVEYDVLRTRGSPTLPGGRSLPHELCYSSAPEFLPDQLMEEAVKPGELAIAAFHPPNDKPIPRPVIVLSRPKRGHGHAIEFAGTVQAQELIVAAPNGGHATVFGLNETPFSEPVPPDPSCTPFDSREQQISSHEDIGFHHCDQWTESGVLFERGVSVSSGLLEANGQIRVLEGLTCTHFCNVVAHAGLLLVKGGLKALLPDNDTGAILLGADQMVRLDY